MTGMYETYSVGASNPLPCSSVHEDELMFTRTLHSPSVADTPLTRTAFRPSMTTPSRMHLFVKS